VLGYLKDVEARFYPSDHGLDAFGRGGTFGQTDWPELKIKDLRLHYAKPILTVNSAVLSIGQPHNFVVTGSFKFGQGGAMRLHLHSTHAPADPFTIGFWHGKLDGVFDSDTDLHKEFETGAKVDATGEIHFTRAIVHDVQALSQIAVLTRHPQFEKPKIDVLNIRAEAKGLLRLEGDFAIENQEIEGKFKIGVAPDVAESIPGAREKVFTDARGSYLWTTVSLSGPAHHPREDLKQRLVAAAQEHFAKGFLSSIFKPGKTVLEMLDSLYE
jgi:hypothetical protein